MHCAIACFLVLPLAPAQQGELEIANARATYGYLGATYPPSKKGRLAGDILHFSFDIKNLKLDKNGRASYSLFVEILNDKGRPQYTLGPTNSIAQNFLGGNSMPCSAHMEIPLDTPPGEYLFRLTVTDRNTEKSVVFERKGKVRAPEFDLIQVAMFADRESKVPASPVGVVGESLYVHFAAVGFARDKTSQQPDLEVSLRIIDEQGKPTFPNPLRGTVTKDVSEDTKILPLQFGLTLNRTGQFTIEIEAHCKQCGKSVKTTLPLRVVAQ